MDYVGQWGWGGPGHFWALKWQRAKRNDENSRIRIRILLMVLPDKGTDTKFFASGIFHGSPSPKPLKTTLESLQMFSRIRGDISQVKVLHWYQRHRWWTLSCKYLREFSKNFETALMVYSGAWGKLIHEKNQKSKISWHCPFNFSLSSNIPSVIAAILQVISAIPAFLSF